MVAHLSRSTSVNIVRSLLSLKDLAEERLKVRTSKGYLYRRVGKRVIVSFFRVSFFTLFPKQHEGPPEQKGVHICHLLLLSQVNMERYFDIRLMLKQILDIVRDPTGLVSAPNNEHYMSPLIISELLMLLAHLTCRSLVLQKGQIRCNPTPRPNHNKELPIGRRLGSSSDRPGDIDSGEKVLPRLRHLLVVVKLEQDVEDLLLLNAFYLNLVGTKDLLLGLVKQVDELLGPVSV